ncbi:hypothetical protein BgiMline_015644 [Biomphalaria glabrata]|nr:hypothetical protein BgiMline_034971 [Biomphalaria glabrata]
MFCLPAPSHLQLQYTVIKVCLPQDTCSTLLSRSACPKSLAVHCYQGLPAPSHLQYTVIKVCLPQVTCSTLLSRSACPKSLAVHCYQGLLAPSHLQYTVIKVCLPQVTLLSCFRFLANQSSSINQSKKIF